MIDTIREVLFSTLAFFAVFYFIPFTVARAISDGLRRNKTNVTINNNTNRDLTTSELDTLVSIFKHRDL